MDYLLIILGFVVLVFGANYLVDGAIGIAKRFNVPDLIIGLTIVAFGTSAPELVVNLIAASNPATTDLALTNIIGSNMINTYVILGLTALVFPIKSQLSSRKFDIPFSLLAPIVLLFMAWAFDNKINRVDGIILLLIFSFFMYATARKTFKMKAIPEIEELEKTTKPKKVWLSIVFIIGGLAMLIIGGQLIVNSATKIAQAWGISQAVIGLTIVALGTSLPELATSVVAAFKKNSDIALGNVIGSNIFNVFFILGISTLVRPLPAYPAIFTDLLITALGSLLVLIFVFTNKKHEIKRWEGLLLLIIYGVYLYWMITQQ
ncbi:sodium:calcium antiporter [Paludibacter sp. 221]|uniref:calcium/sodium antiporter n=1 Tax=Paludibacter sp. 221 TaxID=2302939 RepID=UPI0013D6AB70|nr:calcium/sodium antiporter [Paludibacter sp. 221]NDV47314.1 sodium:calcium antiporter [Paludibacter sp. 221]